MYKTKGRIWEEVRLLLDISFWSVLDLSVINVWATFRVRVRFTAVVCVCFRVRISVRLGLRSGL